MYRVLGIFFLWSIVACITSCSVNEKQETKRTVITGKLDLPKGTMYLVEGERYGHQQRIDSQRVTNGSFAFNLVPPSPSAPYSIVFYDEKNTKYEFSFNTNRTLNGGPFVTNFFMADDSILIRGSLEPFIPIGFKLPDSIKLYTVTDSIIAGKQTKAMYNINYDFFQPVTGKSFAALKQLINEYNYSYYLIGKLNKSRNQFTADQLSILLEGFNKDIHETDEYKQIIESLKFRPKNGIGNIEFEDSLGNPGKIEFSKAKINMVVLWASWCGPCRKEIPVLKNIYDKYGKSVNMVSISLDDDHAAWLKAMKEEGMRWQQFILPVDMKSYQNELFSFDGSIPTTLFYNNKGLLLKKTVGYDTSLLNTYSDIISAHL